MESSSSSSLKTAFANKKRSHIFDSITDLVGQTPIVKLANDKMNIKDGVEVYVKVEAQNPGGSIKDRLAYGMIEWAEMHGQLKPGQTVVEASSGNTGISLAMICAAKGYPFVCVMSEAFSIERRKLMRFLGAQVILTNPAHKASGMVIKCQELAAEHDWYWPNQFESEANAWIHEQTTGPEIVEAFAAENKTLNHFCMAYGTGGTVLGTSRVLRKESPSTKIHICEPDNAPMLYSGIKTTYPEAGAGPSTSFEVAHPVWRPHLFQGWAADFIPKIVAKAQEEQLYDSIINVGGKEAMETTHRLATTQGIFTGTSGGGVLVAALKLAKDAEPGTTILAVLADTGERYLSTPLFADIPADMTLQEKELAASTPSTPPPAPGLPGVLAEAVDFVHQTNTSSKVVVWSLEYCEFCWTLTRFLDALGVEYERIDIDSFQYAKNNMGNKYRSALQDLTGCKTFPQFFVNNKFLGGAVDACMMWKKQELQPIFKEAGVGGGGDDDDDNFNGYDRDPFEFLPRWMTQNPMRDR